MNKHRVLVSIIILSLTYSVTCDDAEEIKRLGLNRARQKYRYNHPPAVENIENIPVAIVYDKVIDRKSRRQKVESDTLPTKPTVSPLDTEDKLAVTSVPENGEGKFTTTAIGNTKQPESRNLKLSFKIPVSVVYDEEPNHIRKNRIKSAVSSRLRNTNKRQRKPSVLVPEKSQSTIALSKENGENDKSQIKLTTKNMIDDFTDKQSQTERGTQTKLSGSNVPTRADIARRPISAKNTEKHFSSKESNVNSVEESPKIVTKTEVNIPTEYAYQEKPSQAVTTETSSTIKSVSNATGPKREHGEPDPIVPIVSSENRVFGQNGEFKYSYEGGDGTRAFSKGKLKTFDEKVAGEAVEGGFSYKDKDGNDFSLSYTADEHGYRPVGAHLPTPPPIPPAIARALAYLATKPTPEPVTEAIDD